MKNEPTRRFERLIVHPSLVLLCLVVYSGCFRAGFHADDWSHSYVVRGFRDPLDLVFPPFPFNTSFRPVYLAHLWLLARIASHSIFLARVWVVLIHAMCAILVYEIAGLFFRSRRILHSLLAATWFAVAFCHFEVPNALTNSETPGVFFLLAFLYLLLRGWPRYRKREVFLLFLMWGAGLLSKEYLLWVPVGLVFAHWWLPESRKMKDSDFGVMCSGMVLGSALFLWRFMTLDRDAVDMALLVPPTISFQGVTHFFSSIVSLPLMDPLHPRWKPYFEPILGEFYPLLWGVRILFFLVLIGGVGFLWRSGRRGLTFFAATLVCGPLLLTCWLPGPPASRHVYLPSVGFGLGLAGVFAGLGKPGRRSFRFWCLLLLATLILEGTGNWMVGKRLERVTQERERITALLEEDLVTISPDKKVYLEGLPSRVRVEMALPFLFPDRTFFSLTPSPLLKIRPIERLRRSPPPDSESIVLIFEGNRFRRETVSRYLEDITP